MIPETKEAIGHMVVVAGDYPEPGHMKLVFVQQLVHAMIDQGVMITVVAPQSLVHALVYKERLLPKQALFRTNSGLEYRVFRPRIITLGNLRLFSKGLRWWNRHVLSRLMKRLKPDTLYAHFWSSARIVEKYANDNSIPIFVACGEGDDALEDIVKTVSQKELDSLKNNVKGVICVSSENKRKCIRYSLADNTRIGVFPNCVDTNLFRRRDRQLTRAKIGAKDDDFVIVFVGGFIPRKGPERLAEAISIINDPSIKVIFIGKEFPGYPLDFDCPGILFKGQVDHDELPDYLSCSDLFVLPTQKEGCCNAIVEALSIGLPIVSSDGAFNDDILDEFNSIRVNPNSVSSIADAILRLKNNPCVRDQMSRVSISRHDSYSISGRASRIISFISEICMKENRHYERLS